MTLLGKHSKRKILEDVLLIVDMILVDSESNVFGFHGVLQMCHEHGAMHRDLNLRTSCSQTKKNVSSWMLRALDHVFIEWKQKEWSCCCVHSWTKFSEEKKRNGEMQEHS